VLGADAGACNSCVCCFFLLFTSSLFRFLDLVVSGSSSYIYVCVCVRARVVETENIPHTFDSGISANHFLDFTCWFIFLSCFLCCYYYFCYDLSKHARTYLRVE
jgi:hypothetical protein